MSHKDRKLQRARKEEARKPRLSKGFCVLCRTWNPKSVTCSESAAGHIILEGES